MKNIIVFAGILMLLLSQAVQAGNFFEDMFSNKPKTYFGSVFSYSPVAISVGTCYLRAPLDSSTVTTTYLTVASFTDTVFWQSKDLGQLGDAVIVYGSQSTIFGRDGIQPFWGYTAYNMKYWSFNLGLGLYAVDDLIAKHINLSYDFFLERTSIDFSFMF